MQKEWQGNKLDIYSEDAVNDQSFRRRFTGAVKHVTDNQVSAFTQAIDSVSDLPVAYAVLIEENRFSY